MSDLSRFFTHVEITATGCWEWTAARDKDGYGLFKRTSPRKMVRAHRFLYELMRGPIPEGLTLDHIECDNPPCTNPWHLKPATSWENTARGTSPWAQNARKTHCKYGHEFTEENTYRQRSGRGCRVCARRATNEWRARQKANIS